MTLLISPGNATIVVGDEDRNLREQIFLEPDIEEERAGAVTFVLDTAKPDVKVGHAGGRREMIGYFGHLSSHAEVVDTPSIGQAGRAVVARPATHGILVSAVPLGAA